MNNRSQRFIPILIVILGFFSFGLTDLIWIYIISDRVNKYRFLPIKQLALTLITLGIYGILWTHTISNEVRKSLDSKNNINPLICTILSVAFLRNISIAIIYNNIIPEESAGE